MQKFLIAMTIISASLFSFCSAPVEAVMVTDYLEMTITSISNSTSLPDGHAVNDKFSASVTYDDSNLADLSAYGYSERITDATFSGLGFEFSYGATNPIVDRDEYFYMKVGAKLTSQTLFTGDLKSYYYFENYGFDTQGNFNLWNLGSSQTLLVSYGFDYNIVPSPVPEPGTMLLLGAGLGGLAIYRRRSKK